MTTSVASRRVVGELATDRPQKRAVYAIVRFDLFLSPSVPASAVATVKEVLPTLAEAEAEAVQLNASVDPGRIVYIVQPTRYFPEGRGPVGPRATG